MYSWENNVILTFGNTGWGMDEDQARLILGIGKGQNPAPALRGVYPPGSKEAQAATLLRCLISSTWRDSRNAPSSKNTAHSPGASDNPVGIPPGRKDLNNRPPGKKPVVSRTKEPWVPRGGRPRPTDEMRQEWKELRERREQELRDQLREEEQQWREKHKARTEPDQPKGHEDRGDTFRQVTTPSANVHQGHDAIPPSERLHHTMLPQVETLGVECPTEGAEPSHIRQLRATAKVLRHRINRDHAARDSVETDSPFFAARNRLIQQNMARLEEMEARLHQWEAQRIAEPHPMPNPVELGAGMPQLRTDDRAVQSPGRQQPRHILGIQRTFERDPAVKAWVLQQAEGVCELCSEGGPFLLPNGDHYLEVHHVKPLADGGPDTIDNAVGLCPNCHRRVHLAVDAREQVERLYAQVPRLRR